MNLGPLPIIQLLKSKSKTVFLDKITSAKNIFKLKYASWLFDSLRPCMHPFYSQKPQYTIAHRGLSSLLPENTIESIEASLLISDFAEFDVMLTKDHIPIIFHDESMSRLTNVAEHPEFTCRKRIGMEHDEQKEDWWIQDFTLEQLKTLRVRQAQNIKTRPEFFNWKFSIPSLADLLARIIQYKQDNPTCRNSGLMIEIKSRNKQTNALLTERVASVLKQYNLFTREGCAQFNLPILMASFEDEINRQVKSMSDLPILQLIDKEQKYDLNEISSFAQGVGITEEHLSRTSFKFVQESHEKGLKVFYWTLRNDNQEIPFGHSRYEQVYHTLVDEGVDGLITEYPEYTEAFLEFRGRKATV